MNNYKNESKYLVQEVILAFYGSPILLAILASFFQDERQSKKLKAGVL